MVASLEARQETHLGARQEARMERGMAANLEAIEEIDLGARQEIGMERSMEANLGKRHNEGIISKTF